MTDRELMQMALYALEWCYDVTEWPANGNSPQDKAVEALRARLAQPEPEPVAWMHDSHVGFNVPLYTAPPQREWQGLTDEEIKQLWKDTPQLVGVYSYTDIAREVEAKLKEKNT